MGKVLCDAAFNVADRMASLPQIVAPTLPHLRKDVHDLLKEYRGEVHIITDAGQKWNAFKSMDVALACSGTVGLELAMLQTPHIIAYKVNPITFEALKLLVKVKYAHLANIIADREIVPEFIQNDCKADDIADKAFHLLMSPDQQREQFAGIARRLGAHQKETPSQKAAAFVLGFAK
jgi:lipid-A-disaccharide synthase